MGQHRVILGDSKEVLKSFPDNSIHLAVTSPPYFNAREYSQWTTLDAYLVAMRTNRNSAGIDIKREFVNLGLKRLKEKSKQKTLIDEPQIIEFLEEKDIKNKMLKFEKSQIFHKETYMEESKKRHINHLKKLNSNNYKNYKKAIIKKSLTI